jgi:hypothetical protein
MPGTKYLGLPAKLGDLKLIAEYGRVRAGCTIAPPCVCEGYGVGVGLCEISSVTGVRSRSGRRLRPLREP